MMADIKIGAAGWEHSGWLSAFYPDDLPADWRLSYYANEFQIVQIPPALWLSADVDVFTQWRDDVADSFRFILDISNCMAEQGALESLQQCLKTLGEKVAGLVSWVPLSAEEIERVGSVGGNDLLLSLSEESIVPEAGVLSASNRHSCCLLMSTEVARDLVVLRKVMERLLLSSVTETEVYLLFAGEPPEMKVLKDAKILKQLLAGIAG
ncbi:MAG: hypothetical protein OQL27_12595 [Sedimenticola sp.]|nr:hypothetical protein [Sedimenticola sp.]